MKRYAFTLTELLVAVAIIILLTLLVLSFFPRRETTAAIDAASQIESTLAGAKARALREGRPVGVRLLTSDNYRTFYGMQLIVQPSNYAPIGNGIRLELPTGFDIQAANQNAGPVVGNTARQVGVSLQGSVDVGDYLEIVEVTPSIHRIEAIDFATGTMTLAATKQQIDTDGDGIPDQWWVDGVPNVNSTARASLLNNYRYIRGPRPLMGEPPIQFPRDVLIVGASGVVPTSLNIPVSRFGEYELWFSPSGQLLNANGQRIVLWIQDTNGVAKPILLCIHSATGAIRSVPVGDAGSEFAFTQDGK